jgi:hypothetical protein
MGAASVLLALGRGGYLPGSAARAQSQPAQTAQVSFEQRSQMSDASAAQDPSQQPSSASEPKEKSNETKEGEKKKHHRGAIVVAPLPIVSPAIGAGIVPVLPKSGAF